jgi:hypothetical protein
MMTERELQKTIIEEATKLIGDRSRGPLQLDPLPHILRGLAWALLGRDPLEGQPPNLLPNQPAVEQFVKVTCGIPCEFVQIPGVWEIRLTDKA